jgi:hypothetical protein
MAVRRDAPGPYAPPRAILDIINRFRHRGLATPFDADVLARAGVSTSLIPRTIHSLRALDLIDESGDPTEQLINLQQAPEPEFQARLAEVVRAAYAEIFNFADPATDDAQAVRDAFRPYRPTGQQNRMVSLFLGLSAAAGLIPQSAGTEGQAVRPIRSAVPRRVPNPALRTPRSEVRIRDTARQSATGLPPALEGLLNALPSNNAGWTQDERDRFVATFEAVLDFSYPIREAVTEGEDE